MSGTGLRAPLSVRINDGRTDRHVTRRASGLKFRRTAPGGFVDAGVRVDLGRSEFSDLGPADKMIVAGPDRRTLWEGFLENPRATDGTAGQALDLQALGTVTLTQDRTETLIYIERDLARWNPYAKNVKASNATQSDDPADADDDPGLIVQLTDGSVAATGATTQLGYPGFVDSGMFVGAIRATYKSGVADGDYALEMTYSGPGVTAGAVTLQDNLLTSSRGSARYVGDAGAPPAGTHAVALRMRRTGPATNVYTDNVWTWFHNVAVLGRRMSRRGVLVSGLAGMKSVDGVRADWIIEDLLGRCVPGLIDVDASVVEAATYLIDQLAYVDGSTMGAVLDDLSRYEPDLLWEMLEHTGVGYRFNYRRWPETVRYELSTRDGYEAPGSDSDLCNRIAVTWKDPDGRDKSVTVRVYSTTYPALSALEEAGRIHDAPAIRLPDGKGSLANAVQIGEQTLAKAASLSKAARITTERPVRDLLRGGWAMPWEIEPGYVARVMETGDVLRLTEHEYDDDALAANLTLGTPQRTAEQLLTQLAKVAAKR
jgi:hypothetical protein